MTDLGELAADFVEHGYVVARQLLTPAEVSEVNGRIPRFARGGYPVVNPQDLPTADSDEEALANILAVHFPHWVDPMFVDLIRHPAVVEVLAAIVGAHLPGWDGRVKAMQSMLFVKPPGLPGQAWHQDEHFIPTRDRSLCGAWIALDDATIENGCLWVVPGSHRSGMLYPTRAHGRPDEYDTATEAWDISRPGFTSFDDAEPEPVAVPVSAGDVVFFNGHILHKSLRNRSTTTYRRALVNHYCNAWSQLPWHVPGIESGDDFRVVVPVHGEDPYAWKGYPTSPSSVFVRPHRVIDCSSDIDLTNIRS